MQPQAPQNTDLLLIGGGHSHLAVVKQLGMRPIPGLRITMISKDIHTPYSGMMPGLIAGHYDYDDTHIDLRKLCQHYGVRLFNNEVNAIDLNRQQVYCNNRPPVRFDWLSINTGSQPDLSAISGADSTGIPIKPIEGFLKRWKAYINSLHKSLIPITSPIQLAVVGGGAASIEVVLAIQYQLQQQLGHNAEQIHIELVCGTEQLLPSYNRRVQRHITQLLAQRNITIKLDSKVTAVRPLFHSTTAPTTTVPTTTVPTTTGKQLVFADGSTHRVDQVIWAVHAGSPQWPQQSGLDCDANGFIRVNQYLQSTSHNTVFAAGDIAHFDPQPVAKSGVYAVRAGRILAKNLHRAITGKTLHPYRPQHRFLSLLTTGDKNALACRGALSLQGQWLWRWKNIIDRQFIDNYHNLPSMDASTQPATSAISAVEPEQMRCGGCGAKIGKTVLQRVMAKLETNENPDVVIGLNAPDDAAVIEPPVGKQWLQTVDYFRAFIDDPYLLGRIATNHCLSDIHAMGATAHSALAIATVPHANETLVEDTLLQLMSGAMDSLNEQHTTLIGGHSSEGAELGFGLSVNGTLDQTRLLTKGALSHGQVLILTKPLGTGTLLAANGMGQAQGRWIENALQHMLISNQRAATIMQQHQATACTDITGFGLLGHLLEMLTAANSAASLQLDKLPVLDGAIHCTANGWLSSLQPDNLHAEEGLINRQNHSQHPHYPLLFDPQTSGGLLAALPATAADACLQDFQQQGYPAAAIIGVIDETLEAGKVILL